MMLETADPMIERFDPVMCLGTGSVVYDGACPGWDGDRHHAQTRGRVSVPELQERAQFSKLSIHVFAVFGMPAIEMQLKSLGDRLDIVAKPFNQHTGVTFDLVSSGGDFVAEAGSRSFLGLTQGDDILAQFSGGGFRRLAQGDDVLAQFSGGGFRRLAQGDDVLAQFSGGGFRRLAQRDDILAQFSGSGLRRLTQGDDILAQFSRRGLCGLTQRGHVLAQALGDRRHDPFNLCKGF